MARGVALVARLTEFAEIINITSMESAPAVFHILDIDILRGAVVYKEQHQVEIRTSRGLCSQMEVLQMM